MRTFDTPGELVRLYEQRTKKRFGQHFLVDPNILGDIADAAGIAEGDRVVEVGPGCGTLTLTLLGRGASVLAVELDRDLVSFLNEWLVGGRALEVVQGDVLDQDLAALVEPDGRPWKCAANLPYNAATEIFFRLAEIMDRFSTLVLMFQREVAHRMVARAGDDDYSTLSVMTRLHCDAEIVMTLPPGAFRPPPRVHSAVVRFDPVAGTRIPDERRRGIFRTIVRQAFQTRRKTLPNALSSTGVSKTRLKRAIDAVGLDLKIRPERVPFDAFLELADQLEAEF